MGSGKVYQWLMSDSVGWGLLAGLFGMALWTFALYQTGYTSEKSTAATLVLLGAATVAWTIDSRRRGMI